MAGADEASALTASVLELGDPQWPETRKQNTAQRKTASEWPEQWLKKRELPALTEASECIILMLAEMHLKNTQCVHHSVLILLICKLWYKGKNSNIVIYYVKMLCPEQGYSS